MFNIYVLGSKLRTFEVTLISHKTRVTATHLKFSKT